MKTPSINYGQVLFILVRKDIKFKFFNS